MRVTAASILVGSIALLPFLRASTFRQAGALSAGEWGWVLLLGAGASAAGYVIFVWALARLGATRVSVSIYLVPVFALVTAWLIRDEPLGLPVAGAAILVVGGVVLTQRGGVTARTQIPPPTEEPVVAAPDR
jgi:drug/metabolite transporter (DMT)-like permease